MTRKRHADPADVLTAVIRDLERDRPRAAVLTLLAQGPLLCSEVFLQELEQPAVEQWDEKSVPAASIVGGELLAFLRQLVRLKDGGDFGYGIWITERVAFHGAAHGHVVTCTATGSMRDVAILELVLLVQAVGIPNVRICSAEDCPRLFVKTYRREYCSERCQKRTLARQTRRAAREQKDRTRARRHQQQLHQHS